MNTTGFDPVTEGAVPSSSAICGDSSIGRIALSKSEDMGSSPTAVPKNNTPDIRSMKIDRRVPELTLVEDTER